MKSTVSRISFLFFTTLLSVITWAQDETKKVDVDINVGKNTQWYQQTWVWVAGGAVFILLLVALLRGSGSKKEA